MANFEDFYYIHLIFNASCKKNKLEERVVMFT